MKHGEFVFVCWCFSFLFLFSWHTLDVFVHSVCSSWLLIVVDLVCPKLTIIWRDDRKLCREWGWSWQRFYFWFFNELSSNCKYSCTSIPCKSISNWCEKKNTRYVLWLLWLWLIFFFSLRTPPPPTFFFSFFNFVFFLLFFFFGFN